MNPPRFGERICGIIIRLEKEEGSWLDPIGKEYPYYG